MEDRWTTDGLTMEYLLSFKRGTSIFSAINYREFDDLLQLDELAKN